MLDAKIAAFRLRRNHLAGDSRADAATICRDICGAQSQILPAACLQVWVRNRRITRASIEDALWNSRTLVRTSLMRQTLHMIPTGEFPLYIAALRDSRVAAVLRVMARCGMTPADSDTLTEAILETLAAGPMTRAQITAAVRPLMSKRVRGWMDKVWSIVRIPVSEGLVCYGDGAGNQVKFIRTDQWLPKWRAIPAAEAQDGLLRRYLRAYGPAHPRDFAYWSGMTAKECAQAFQRIKGELVEIPGAGMILADDRKVLESARPVRGVKLLPAFDPYLLAHHAKEHLLEKSFYKRVYRNQGWISPVVLLNGRVAGTWSHRLEGGECAVQSEMFPGSSRAVAAVEAQAAKTRAFLLSTGTREN